MRGGDECYEENQSRDGGGVQEVGQRASSCLWKMTFDKVTFEQRSEEE